MLTSAPNTLAQHGFTRNGVGPIAQATSRDQFEIRLLASHLDVLHVPYYHRGYVFTSSDQGSFLDWTIHRCTYGGRRFWLLTNPVGGKVEHYSDVILPQSRHEGTFKEGLFMLSRCNPEFARRLLRIRADRPVDRFKLSSESAREHDSDHERKHEKDLTCTPFLPSKSA
jgi:hypothetical protein